MKKRIIVAIVFVLFAGGVAAAWWIYTSPGYSLRVIQKAVEQHDVTTFEKCVDIEGVIGRLLGELPGLLSGREELKILGDEAAQLIQEFAKDSVVRAGKNAVETFIERGHFDEKLTEQGVLSKFLKAGRVRDIKFLKLKEVKAEGKICYVTLAIHVEAYDGDADVTFMMRDKGMYWQVAEMSNVSGFLNSLATLQSEYRFRDLSAATLYLLESGPSPGKNTQAGVYAALAKAAVSQGQNDEAERLLKTTLALCETMTEQSWTSIRAGCIADAGVVYFQLGHKDKGRELIRSAATGAGSWGADARRRFREIAVRLAEDDHMEEALAEIAAIGDPREKVQAFVDVAAALQQVGKDERGAELLEQAGQAMHGVDDTSTRARLFGQIGTAWAARGAQEQANEMFAIAEENIAALSDARSSARSWVGLSGSLLVAGRQEAAATAIRKAIDGLEGLKDHTYAYDTSASLVAAAVVLHALGQEGEADAILSRVPEKELKQQFRFGLLAHFVQANKLEEAVTGAGDDEIGLVAGAVAEKGNFELALNAASRVSDIGKRRGILLGVAKIALSSDRAKSRQPEIANRVMTLAQSG